MNQNEKKEAKKFAQVLRAARKQKGIGQVSLANQLGISQSLLSKLENAMFVPSAPTWFHICDVLDLQFENGVTGFIDRRKEASISNVNDSGTFKIPHLYSYAKGSMARTARPLLHFFTKQYGAKKTEEFIRSKNIDPDFFVILDNPININFNLELVKHFLDDGVIKQKTATKLAGFMKESLMHGALAKDYENFTSEKDLLSALAHNLPKYETNWKYVFDFGKKGVIDLECEPNSHLKEFKELNGMTGFINEYRRGLIQTFVSDGLKQEVKNTFKTVYESGEKCVYQIQTAS